MKKTRVLPVLLHILSGLSVFFASYGVWCLIMNTFLHHIGEGEWISTLCTVVIASAAMAMRMLLTRTKLSPWSLDVLTAVLAVISAVGSGFFWYFVLALPIEAAIAAGLISVAAVLVGNLCARRPPGMYALMGIGGLLLFCFVVIRLAMADDPYPAEGFVWVFFLASACITAGANYRGIDRHMTRRGHSRTRLPGKVRRNNLLMLTGLYSFGALVLLLRKPLVGGLKALIRGILLALDTIMKWILSLIPVAPGFGTQDYGKEMDMSGLAEKPLSRSDIFFWIVFGIGAVFLVVISVKPFLAWLREKLDALRTLVMRWLRRRGTAAGDESTGDYEDVTEELGSTMHREKKAQLTGLRGWKREIRKFSRMPAGRERFTEGYRLLLRGSTLRGAKLELSDTPRETGKKIQPLVQGADMTVLTAQAEEIVFSGREADTDTAGVENALEILKKKS